MKKILTAAILLAVGSLAACSSDEKTGPIQPVDLAECTLGTMTPGATREFTLGGDTGCTVPDIWLDEENAVRAASYTMRLTANRLYAFRAVEKNATDASNFDIVAAIFGPAADSSIYGWLTASDDEWGGVSGYAPLIYFVPEVTGNYAVRVAGYNATDLDRDVVLTSDECPIGPTVAQSANRTTTNASIAADGCVASNSTIDLFEGVDSTRVAAIRLTLAAGATRRVRIVSTAFTPTAMVVGPGHDLWAMGPGDQVWESDIAASDTADITVTAEGAGTYTLLVGAAEGVRTGAFQVVIDPATPPPALRAATPTRRQAKAAR